MFECIFAHSLGAYAFRVFLATSSLGYIMVFDIVMENKLTQTQYALMQMASKFPFLSSGVCEVSIQDDTHMLTLSHIVCYVKCSALPLKTVSGINEKPKQRRVAHSAFYLLSMVCWSWLVAVKVVDPLPEVSPSVIKFLCAKLNCLYK